MGLGLGALAALPFAASTAAGVAQMGADIWAGRQSAEDQRIFNREEAVENRAFQERMSSTAYQRAVADMKQAGLNPIMAFSQGGASSPSGGQATSGQASTGSASASMNSALAASKLKSEIGLLDAQAASARANADLTGRTMPPADPWRILLEMFGRKGIGAIGSTARNVADYVSDTVKTFPLRPQTQPYRQPLQPLTDRQREQLRRTGSYTRPARKH